MKIILTYLDDESKAEQIINVLLQERLAACISIFPCRSRYWWKGKVKQNDKELVVWIKTKDRLADKVMQRVKQLHPYDLPVIEIINVEAANSAAEAWVDEVTK